MALMNHTQIPSFTFLNLTHNSLLSPNSSFNFATQRFKLLTLTTILSSSSSSSISTSDDDSKPSIFLPFLKEEEKEDEFEEIERIPDDPIYKFFKSRTSTQDPPRESKLTLQSNRRTAWHLADHMEETETELEPGIEFEFNGGGKTEVGGIEGCENESIVREVIRIAKNLPENSTLGEELRGYDGRVGEEECVKVLSLMIKEGMMMNCLYFYEWMGLQEPCVVSPRACSVLFPALGRARMGDKLLILWRNLPNTMEFRDVHVYNAAISGLLCCERYQGAWEVYEAMELNNIQPDRMTGSTMITVMRKQGKSAKDAWDFFERMNRKGVYWSLEVVGALIKTFCDEGLLKQALIIQGEMEKKGISSNTIVYNTLMDAYCKSNRLEEAEALFVGMKTKGC